MVTEISLSIVGAANGKAPVVLHQQAANEDHAGGVEGDNILQATVCAQANDALHCQFVELAEGAAHQDGAIGFHLNFGKAAIGCKAGLKAVVEAAVRIQAEDGNTLGSIFIQVAAPNEDFAIRL